MDKAILAGYLQEGLSTTEIMELTQKSQSTIRYWYRKYDFKLNPGYKTCVPPFDKANPPAQLEGVCSVHFASVFIYEVSRKGYRCKQCRSDWTRKRMYKVRNEGKEALVELAGGQCCKCEYNKCLRSLDFHHINKRNERGVTEFLSRDQFQLAQQEARHCLLLCRNCHRHEHADYYARGLIDDYQCAQHGINWKSRSCASCKAVYVKRKRRELKQSLVEAKGDKCLRCEKQWPIYVYEFHHRNPLDKIKSVSSFVSGLQYELAQYEAAKCDLLCANCHSEVEAAKSEQPKALL